MCRCKTTVGGTVVCDDCASRMIEALNDLTAQHNELPVTLTTEEYQGLSALVNQWTATLEEAIR